ncbi:MAG TPA: formate dehydrogenase accessory sulfurtransferase FdhD, partial [Gaiellaceae bacterium]|nr:formate dehydrogenase accessory sulfurtransferase FdhD [Gaiellaceae bacterium]
MDAPPYSAAPVEVVRLPGGASERDRVAVEEPLEIRIGGRPVAVTMRTPGHDEELGLGFCLSEGLRPVSARLPDDLAANAVDVDAPGFDPERLRRSFYTSSSCGVCGKGALEAVAVEAPRVESRLTVQLALVASLPDRLRAAQAAFEATGGLHATGLFSTAGELLCVREDVGRHNALDKVVGWAFGAGRLPLAESLLCVSGRLSFELVQKAAVAGCPILVAVGAPSSSRATAGSRSAASCAAGRRTSTPSRGGSSRTDRRPARRRGEHTLRLAEGGRRLRRGDVARPRVARARRGVRRTRPRRARRRSRHRAGRGDHGGTSPVDARNGGR